jgi:hypothetical protein
VKLLKYTKTDPAIASQTTRAYYGERLTPALMQPAIDLAAKYSKFTPLHADEIIYRQNR